FVHSASSCILDGCDLREFDRIRKNSPDRFARRENRFGERRIAVLQKRKDLEEKEIERFAQFGKRRLELSLVIRAELIEQIVDLILERELGEYADGAGVLEPRLERCQIE